MIDYIRKDNYRVLYDDTFQPGDLITTYFKGYFEFVRYEPRENDTPLVFFRKRFNQHGKAINGVNEECCDGSYCQKAKERLVEEIQRLKTDIQQLEQVLISSCLK